MIWWCRGRRWIGVKIEVVGISELDIGFGDHPFLCERSMAAKEWDKVEIEIGQCIESRRPHESRVIIRGCCGWWYEGIRFHEGGELLEEVGVH